MKTTEVGCDFPEYHSDYGLWYHEEIVRESVYGNHPPEERKKAYERCEGWLVEREKHLEHCEEV